MHLRWQNFLKIKFEPKMFRKLCLSVTESIIIFVCVIFTDEMRIKLKKS